MQSFSPIWSLSFEKIEFFRQNQKPKKVTPRVNPIRSLISYVFRGGARAARQPFRVARTLFRPFTQLHQQKPSLAIHYVTDLDFEGTAQFI